MNYYRTMQRMSEGYAARVAEELWPNLAIRRRVCALLAEAIKRAGAGTTAWTVTLDPDSIRLNVGPVQLLHLRDDEVWFCALPPRGVSLPRSLHDCSKGSTVYPSVNVPSRQFWVSPLNVPRIPPTVRLAALEYVDNAALRRQGKGAWLRSHSPGVLLFIESFLKTTLPRPMGEPPSLPADYQDNGAEEGRITESLRRHRSRESRLREAKLAEALANSSDGRLRCEVPGCGFDFRARYGLLGEGYAQVHHLRPLSKALEPVITRLDDLAIICANCHAMIHRNGKDRPFKGLIAHAKGKTNA